MGQRIKASYYCPIHNLFDVHCVLDPPRYVVCPVCLKPSELCSFFVTQVEDNGMGNDDWASFVEELMKLSGYDINAKISNGDSLVRRPKQPKIDVDEVSKKIIDNHEMIERAKMDAALYHDGWED